MTAKSKQGQREKDRSSLLQQYDQMLFDPQIEESLRLVQQINRSLDTQLNLAVTTGVDSGGTRRNSA